MKSFKAVEIIIHKAVVDLHHQVIDCDFKPCTKPRRAISDVFKLMKGRNRFFGLNTNEITGIISMIPLFFIISQVFTGIPTLNGFSATHIHLNNGSPHVV